MRRWTQSTDDRIYIGTAGLNGFDFRFGTFAVCGQWVSLGAADQTIMMGNDAAGTCCGIGIQGTSGQIFWWDGSADGRAVGTELVTGEPIILAATKPTGTSTVRTHRYRFNSNTWAHIDLTVNTTTHPDGAAMTSFSLGSDKDAAGTSLDAEVWSFAAWSGYAMSDLEIERLSHVADWGRLNPSFYRPFPAGRNSGDMASSLGRYPCRQTTRTGTAAGVQKPPPGFRPDVIAHRRG